MTPDERASSCSHTTTLSIVIETERAVTLCVTADMALVTDRCDKAAPVATNFDQLIFRVGWGGRFAGSRCRLACTATPVQLHLYSYTEVFEDGRGGAEAAPVATNFDQFRHSPEHCQVLRR